MGSGGSTALWSLSKLVEAARVSVGLTRGNACARLAKGWDVASFCVALVVDVYVEAKAT